MTDQVQRFLKTEDLYKEIIDLIFEPEGPATLSETAVRGKLDKILAMGKIEGRLSSFHELRKSVEDAPDDRLIEGWTRIVESE